MEPSLIQHLIGHTLHILHVNHRWMAWNLFLALLPLLLSVVLFRPDLLPPRFRYRSPRSLRSEFHREQPIPEAQTPELPNPELSPDSMRPFRSELTRANRSFDRLDRPRRWGLVGWWVAVLVFVAFLPNAPYVLTDVIHLVSAIQEESSIWRSSFVLIPVFAVFIFLGFEAYVLALINLGYYLRQQGWGRQIVVVELVLHGLSAVGIYLGRFMRFNSWDILTNPDGLVSAVFDDLTGHQPILAMIFSLIWLVALYAPMKAVTLAVCAYRQSRRSGPIGNPVA